MSSIILTARYRIVKNLKVEVSKWLNYVDDKDKADPCTLNKENSLIDEIGEFDDCTIWNYEGDVSKEDVKNSLDNNYSKRIWDMVLSFDPEYVNHYGLYRKKDFYDLTKNVIPKFLSNAGYDLNNVEWFCGLHFNTLHPHIHIMFYENQKKISHSKLPKHSLYEFKSYVHNYLSTNTLFYQQKEILLKDIRDINKNNNYSQVIKNNLFSTSFRKELNHMLLDLYSKLPTTGRLQYNSKNMIPFKKDLDNIITYILASNDIKYKFDSYQRLIIQHQKELCDIYGNSVKNQNSMYVENQLNKLYSKIGNEILHNFKTYQSQDVLNKEYDFISHNLMDMKLRSLNYKNKNNILSLAKGLYSLCKLCDLNEFQIKIIFKNWVHRSHYNFDIQSFLNSMIFYNVQEMNLNEYHDLMKKLGYSYERLYKLKNKNFYKEIHYKKIVHSALMSLDHELSEEEKKIINQLNYELEGF